MKNLFTVLRKLSADCNAPAVLPLWQREFGPAFDVPAVITDRFKDISWHNDVCPCFCITGDEAPRLRLWVDHPDAEQREVESSPRFVITEQDANGDFVKDIFTANVFTEDVIAALLKRAAEIFNR